MPNQMIALQARGPQLPDLSRQTAQYANMMNMARQQEAAQRQSALAQQQMTINAAQEERAAALQGPALTKAQQDNIIQALTIFREGVADVAEGDIGAAEAVRADLVARVPGWDKVIPPATSWDRNTRYRLMVDAAKEIDKTFATPVASLEVGVDGTPRSVVVGNFPGAAGQSTVYDAPETPTAAPRATSTAGAGTSADMRATQGANTTPQDLIDQGMNSNNIPSGMPTSPASFTRGGMGGAGAGQITPEMAQQIVDTAVKTGMMAQADFDQLMTLAPNQNKQPFMDMLNANNITLQPSGMGQQSQFAVNPVQTPEARFADFRGPTPQASAADLGSQPMMRNTLLQSQPRTVTKLQQKTPNVSPYPASAQVPLGRVAGEAAAQEGGKQGVRVKAEPVIAGATKTAELQAQKDAAFSDAQSQFDAAYTTVKNRLSDIKRFKEHPAATRVIGPIDAFTPNIGRARGAQEIYRSMVAAATFDALQEMRTNSPTGGALGNVSDADIRLLKESIGALGQAQDEKDFFESLDIYEDRLNQVLGRLEKRFRESYGYRLGSGWKPAEVATKRRTPTTGGRKAGAFTITEVDE
jgi:hypothetical protein